MFLSFRYKAPAVEGRFIIEDYYRACMFLGVLRLCAAGQVVFCIFCKYSLRAADLGEEEAGLRGQEGGKAWEFAKIEILL